MDTIYNLKEHGDALEKEYADFILTYFKTYEETWKLYIGNKGNDTKSDITGYSNDREEKRQKFSEHTYTILQSLILLNRLIDKDIFTNTAFESVTARLDLQDNLLLFFTHLGRIRDNIKEASTCILNVGVKLTTSLLDEFYHKRHILVHGKTLPIIFKSSGEILLPVLSKNGIDISGWNHKEHAWGDVVSLPIESIQTTVSQLYWELLSKLTQIFGEFRTKIKDELNQNSLKLVFDRTQTNVQTFGSGSNAVDVYGLANKNIRQW